MYCPKCKIDTGKEKYCENCGTEAVDKLENNNKSKKSSVKKGNLKIKKPSIRKGNIKSFIKFGVAAVIIVVLIFGYNNLKSSYSPDAVAEKYVDNITEGNTEEAFKMLDIQENEFIDKSSYDKFIDNMQIEGKESVVSEARTEDFVAELLGTKKESYSEVMPRDMKYYQVEVEPDIYSLELIKKGKKLGVFDNWLVGSESFITNLKIKAPKGTKLFFKGKEIVAEADSAGIESLSVYYQPEYKEFNISSVFPIEYEITAKLEGAKEVKQVVSPENSTNEIMFKATKDIENKLTNITEKFIKLHYDNSDESEFKDIVSEDFFEIDRMENYIEFVSRELKELSIESTTIGDIDHVSLIANINYDFEEESFDSFFSDETITEKGNADEKLEFLFERINGNWVIVDVAQAY
ncbi:hypothetical protein [Senegalia massiliensis]|uniref:hypothetical protein n=1 Tax=Senegalia massiliensis TaxID=1720316 RepID=UPI001031F4C8|nr:hypothetical protein [Senegalia massiliensis]